jgi:hypothetical protein
MDEMYLDGPKVMTASGSKNAAGLARVVVMTMLEVADELQHEPPTSDIQGRQVLVLRSARLRGHRYGAQPCSGVPRLEVEHVKTQLQIFYEVDRKIGERNELFMDMVRDGSMTNQQLEKLVARWPERYGGYAGFIGKLKDEGETT